MTTTIFKTITIGGKPTLDKDICISSYAQSMIDNISFQKKKEKIDLVMLTPRDLGFTEMPKTTELFNEQNLEKYHVELCPPETGVFLRKEYVNQNIGDWFYVGMKPIADSVDNPRVFYVGCGDDGRLWLHGCWADPDLVWYLDDRIVFRLRKSNLKLSVPQNSSDPQSSSLPAETSVEDYESMKNTLEKMSSDEREVAIVLYLKEIKDLLVKIVKK